MKFAEKVRKARKKAGLTQDELAKAVGLTRKAVNNYETGGIYPRTRDTYKRLADVLNVALNYLLTEEEESVADANELHGSDGAKQAEGLIADVKGLFAGGALSESDKDAVMRALQDAYWEAKRDSTVWYTPMKLKEEGK